MTTLRVHRQGWACPGGSQRDCCGLAHRLGGLALRAAFCPGPTTRGRPGEKKMLCASAQHKTRLPRLHFWSWDQPLCSIIQSGRTTPFMGRGGILHPQGGGRSTSQEFLIGRFWVVKPHKIVCLSCPDMAHFFFTVSDLQFALISTSPLCLLALDVLQTMLKKSPAVCHCNTCSTL